MAEMHCGASRGDFSTSNGSRKELQPRELCEIFLNGLYFGHGVSVFQRAFRLGYISNYFGDANEIIQRLMQQTPDEKRISCLNLKISAIVDWVLEVYLPQKISEDVPSQDLVALLEPKANIELGALVYKLMEDDIAEIALGPFTFTSIMYLTLMQELAVLDPDVTDPLDSDYACPIEVESDTFRTHVEDTFNNIKDVRLSYVTPLSKTVSKHFYRLNSGKVSKLCYVLIWSDDFTGYVHDDITRKIGSQWTNCEPKVVEKFMTVERDDYIQNVTAELSAMLCLPEMAIGAFERINRQVLPMVMPCANVHCPNESRKLKKDKKKSKLQPKKVKKHQEKLRKEEKKQSVKIWNERRRKIRHLMNKNPMAPEKNPDMVVPMPRPGSQIFAEMQVIATREAQSMADAMAASNSPAGPESTSKSAVKVSLQKITLTSEAKRASIAPNTPYEPKDLEKEVKQGENNESPCFSSPSETSSNMTRPEFGNPEIYSGMEILAIASRMMDEVKVVLAVREQEHRQ